MTVKFLTTGEEHLHSEAGPGEHTMASATEVVYCIESRKKQSRDTIYVKH
jgi:hypothetical protein